MCLLKPEEESALLAALERAHRKSPFWRERLSRVGVKKRDFVPGFPFSELPLLTKAELLKDQAEHPPFGRLLAVETNQVRRIHKTSGTTATPFFIALTERDIADTYVVAKRAFSTSGMGPGDRVIHCLSFNMWSGGVSDYMPIEALGATGIPFGVGNTMQLLRTIRKLSVNAISSTPSYMFVLRDKCHDELGVNPRELGLRRGYFGGEGLLQVPGIREEIEETFQMTAMDANYGMSEVLSVIGGEDEKRNGMVYHSHGVLYAELVDSAGAPQPIEEGAKGEFVFSSLRREGQPLFRYRTNDLAEVLWAETAEDGLLRMRFSIIGRTDEMLVIRGVNFFPQSLLTIIAEFTPDIAIDFRVVRPEDQRLGKLRVVLETPLSSGKDRDDLAERLRSKVRSTFQVDVEVQWLPPGSLPSGAAKAKYLADGDEDYLAPATGGGRRR